jgi:hypothetical protein
VTVTDGRTEFTDRKHRQLAATVEWERLTPGLMAAVFGFDRNEISFSAKLNV